MRRKKRGPLTPALLELLQASAAIKSTNAKELARALYRSPNTVKTEFGRIFRRLGVRKRSDAVQVALKNGWIAPSPRRASA
jgi:DNA-binding NarL/FixJ family response regulator